jgi:hypothetical protein
VPPDPGHLTDCTVAINRAQQHEPQARDRTPLVFEELTQCEIRQPTVIE